MYLSGIKTSVSSVQELFWQTGIEGRTIYPYVWLELFPTQIPFNQKRVEDGGVVHVRRKN